MPREEHQPTRGNILLIRTSHEKQHGEVFIFKQAAMLMGVEVCLGTVPLQQIDELQYIVNMAVTQQPQNEGHLQKAETLRKDKKYSAVKHMPRWTRLSIRCTANVVPNLPARDDIMATKGGSATITVTQRRGPRCAYRQQWPMSPQRPCHVWALTEAIGL